VTTRRLGWQGISFEHLAELSPVVLSGDRRQGYVRLEGPGHQLQVRWERFKDEPEPETRVFALENYFKKLNTTDFKLTPSADAVHYRSGKTVGCLLDRGFHRVIVEATSKVALQLAQTTLEVHEGPGPWMLYGLELRLPEELSLFKQELLSGKTVLHFRARGVEMVAERWALGQELLQKGSLSDWASARLGWKSALVREDGAGLRARKPGFVPETALIYQEFERNQLLLLKTRSRLVKWEPSWSWFAAFPDGFPDGPSSTGSDSGARASGGTQK
jgi:hypothetical protein